MRSRLGWILVCLHASWFFLAVANMSPPSPAFAKYLEAGGWSSATLFAGRPFHFTYESLALKSLLVADLPAMLAELPFSFLLLPFLKLAHANLYSGSYISAGSLLLLASCQWLAIGASLQSLLSASKWGTWILGRVRRYFVLIIAVVILFATIATPMINARSRGLGFRQPAISFH